MTFDDVVTIIVEETGMSEDAAKSEDNWYTQILEYPLFHLLGKLKTLKIKEVKQQIDGKFDELFFHDTKTVNGYFSISLLRNVFE